MVYNQKIVPCLWFDDRAEEAANFYVSVFSNSLANNSKVNRTVYYEEPAAQVAEMPEGSVLTVDFTLEGYEFIALNGGPHFKFTPAVSFFIGCKTEAEVDSIYEALVNANVQGSEATYIHQNQVSTIVDENAVHYKTNRYRSAPFSL